MILYLFNHVKDMLLHQGTGLPQFPNALCDYRDSVLFCLSALHTVHGMQ